MSSRDLVREKEYILGAETHGHIPTNLANQAKLVHALYQSNHAMTIRADLGDRRGQIADFQSFFERVKWLYWLCKSGIKTKTRIAW